MSDITEKSDLDFDPHIEIEEDEAYMVRPLLSAKNECYGFRRILVMDKKTFQKMYEEWIVKEGLDRRIL